MSLEKGQKSPQATIDQISWLTGYWLGTAMGGKVEEIWSPPIGNAMLGTFRLVIEDKIIFSELESISEHDGSLVMSIRHFNSELESWEIDNTPEMFQLVEIENNKVYFDGLTIIKESKKKLSIYVLSNNKDGTSEELEFNFVKTKLK